MESVSQDDRSRAKEFLRKFDKSADEAMWFRYSQAMANFPKTWWIGLIQMQMIAGLWGQEHQASAALRQNDLRKILAEAFADLDRTWEVMSESAKYVLEHHKADVLGRLHGGVFTNFALKGGKGSRSLPTGVSVAATTMHFSIATFGAAIWAIGSELKKHDDLLHSILLGRPLPYPKKRPDVKTNHIMVDQQQIDRLASTTYLQLSAVRELNEIEPPPLSVKQFCTRPENIDLRGLCR